MKKKKIAITVKNNSKLWNNGLTQNAYYLIKLLQSAGYDVYPVNELPDNLGELGNLKISLLNKENIKKYNIVIEVCFSLTDPLYDFAIKNKVKVVSINYGNLLMILQENIILKPDTSSAINRPGSDVWISPHFEFSKGFSESLSKSTVKICPYIWSPEIFNDFCKKQNFNPFFDDTTPLKKVGIFEPNINILKTCIYPLLGLEILERRDNNITSDIFVFNGTTLKTNKKFEEIIVNFDIFTNKKISVESRFALPEIISKKIIGSIVSHHIYNDLNYLTLEALYCNLPIIHNSSMCKEAGYFYDTFDATMCSNQIEGAILNHRDNIDNYSKSAKELLFKFSLQNKDNIKNYKYLVENISA